MKEFYVYIYRHADGQPFYVGKGCGNRAYLHLKGNKHNVKFNNTVLKMVENGNPPHIEIIPALNEEHALFMEECLISVLGRQNNGTGCLYNLTDGGNQPPSRKGVKATNEHREKLRLALTKRMASSEAREAARKRAKTKHRRLFTCSCGRVGKAPGIQTHIRFCGGGQT